MYVATIQKCIKEALFFQFAIHHQFLLFFYAIGMRVGESDNIGGKVGKADDGSFEYVGSGVSEAVGSDVGSEVGEAVGFMDVGLSVGVEVVGFMDVGLLLGRDGAAIGFFVGLDVGLRVVGLPDVGFNVVGLPDVGLRVVGLPDVGFAVVGLPDVGLPLVVGLTAHSLPKV
jgi:hypothetical protein